MSVFKIGDEVRIREGTSLWSQYPTLQMAKGRVTGTPPDGGDADRITVEFPDGTSMAGIDAGSFKPASS